MYPLTKIVTDTIERIKYTKGIEDDNLYRQAVQIVQNKYQTYEEELNAMTKAHKLLLNVRKRFNIY